MLVKILDVCMGVLLFGHVYYLILLITILKGSSDFYYNCYIVLLFIYLFLFSRAPKVVSKLLGLLKLFPSNPTNDLYDDRFEQIKNTYKQAKSLMIKTGRSNTSSRDSTVHTNILDF